MGTTKPKSIAAADLGKLTQAAVKAATKGVPGRFVGRGPTMGYVLKQELGATSEVELANAITAGLADNAKAAGIVGLKAKPVVIRRPGGITAGFIAAELNIIVR